MTLAVIILLLLIGILLVFLEILVIPGTTVAGFIGFLLYVSGILYTYDYYGKTAGHLVLLISSVLSVTAIFFALKSNFWSRFQLENKLEGSVNDIDIGDIEVGDKGETLSALRPSGNAIIHNEIFEVQTDGEMLEPHTAIEVTRVEDFKIFVKKS